MNLEGIQKALREDALDGWLLYDFRGSNPIARSVIGFDESQIGTRRWFYLIPALGEPVAILHVIEPHATKGAPGKAVLYRSWKELEALLSERKGERVRVMVPKRGEKRDLVDMAQKNAEQAVIERRRTKDETEVVLRRLQERLHLRNLPRRMECFDISHFQGSSIVASQVAATDGEIDKSRYRRYRIKTLEKQDDFASMHEVISRRLKRGQEEGDLPDLLVIDGGKGQLASALAAAKDLGVEGVDIISLAKSRDLEVHDRDEESARSPERVFIPHRKDPIVLRQNSAELYLLARLRDEAHRFAITFQQKSMRKGNFHSVLEDIPGVGETRKKLMLRHFGSLKRVKEATIEELAEVLGPTVAERVHAALHGHPEEDSEDPIREASLADAGALVDEKSEEGSPPGSP